jgi:hypothetical protein
VPAPKPATDIAARRLRSRPAVWLAAAALAAGVAFALAQGLGPAPVAHHTPPPAPPVPPVTTWPPSPTPQELAATLRREALAACDAKQWFDCDDKLDQAFALDPAGEDVPRIKAARAAAKAGKRADWLKDNAK